LSYSMKKEGKGDDVFYVTGRERRGSRTREEKSRTLVSFPECLSGKTEFGRNRKPFAVKFSNKEGELNASLGFQQTEGGKKENWCQRKV